MFIKVQEYIEDHQAFLCVLTGDVECFAHAQQSALTDTVPTDSVRVVNSLPAQTDQIRRYGKCQVRCSFVVPILHAFCKESAMYIK
jgi:hypothetical protein